MRHQKTGRKFGRNTSHRRAMFRNLAANLVLHERLETTDAKAKELRRIVERLITRATRLGDALTVDVGKLKDAEREKIVAQRVHAQRLVASFLPKTGTVVSADGKPRRSIWSTSSSTRSRRATWRASRRTRAAGTPESPRCSRVAVTTPRSRSSRSSPPIDSTASPPAEEPHGFFAGGFAFSPSPEGRWWPAPTSARMERVGFHVPPVS